MVFEHLRRDRSSGELARTGDEVDRTARRPRPVRHDPSRGADGAPRPPGTGRDAGRPSVVLRSPGDACGDVTSSEIRISSKIRRASTSPNTAARTDDQAETTRIRRASTDGTGLRSERRVHDADVVRRAPANHFTKFVSSTAPEVMTGTESSHIEAKVVSWLLDQNVYELEVMLSGDAEPVLYNEADLGRLGITLDDVEGFFRSHGAPASHEPRERRLEFLREFIRQAPKQLTTDLSKHVEAGGAQATSVLEWDGLTAWGAGVGTTLTMHPGGLPAGSTPHSDPDWIKSIEGHVPLGRSTSIYVRGHLLNHNIGGPGLDYNMVPLTGKPSKNAGGNDANAEHLRGIEVAAKAAWDDVRLKRVAAARYRVVAAYGRTTRAATTAVRQQERIVRQVLDSNRQASFAAVSGMSRVAAEAEVIGGDPSLHGVLHRGGQPIPDEELAALVAAKRSHEFGQQTLVQLEQADPVVGGQLRAALDIGIATASLNGSDPTTVTLHRLLDGLSANAAAWEHEEHVVPTHLDASLQIAQLDGTVGAPTVVKVPNRLPTDPAKVGYRPATKSEWA